MGCSSAVDGEISLVGGAGFRTSTWGLEVGVDRVGSIEGDPVSTSSSVGGGVPLGGGSNCWSGITKGEDIIDRGVFMESM